MNDQSAPDINEGGQTEGGLEVVIEEGEHAAPVATPPADADLADTPPPQAHTASVDVAWEVLDILTGENGLI
jgi:hypothetical protein